jgi:hypothetical protein
MARYPAPVGGKAVAKETPSLAVIPGFVLVEEAAIPDPHTVGNQVVILFSKVAANPVVMVHNPAVMESNRAVMVAENSAEKARGPDQTHISHTNAD